MKSGTYGGTMRVGFTGTNPGWGGLWYIAGWENLVSWAPDFSGVVPNIAESWDVSDDVTQYTFHLRKGMKWSDGVRLHRGRHHVLHQRCGVQHRTQPQRSRQPTGCRSWRGRLHRPTRSTTTRSSSPSRIPTARSSTTWRPGPGATSPGSPSTG